MSGIFISYRRDDAGSSAGRICDRLKAHFGKSNVFMDIDNLRPGVDFVDVLNKTVASCDVFLAVIGRGWLRATNEDGEHRLAKLDDFVRVEIKSALERNILVIPLLVDGADMPRAQDLPDDLSRLTRLNALSVPNNSFHPTIDRLVEAIEEEAAKAEGGRLKQEAAAKAERERLKQEAEAEAERKRLKREAAAKTEEERLKREAAATAEWNRLHHEAMEEVKPERNDREEAARSKQETLRQGRTVESVSKRLTERTIVNSFNEKGKERTDRLDMTRLAQEPAIEGKWEPAATRNEAERQRLNLEAEIKTKRKWPELTWIVCYVLFFILLLLSPKIVQEIGQANSARQSSEDAKLCAAPSRPGFYLYLRESDATVSNASNITSALNYNGRMLGIEATCGSLYGNHEYGTLVGPFIEFDDYAHSQMLQAIKIVKPALTNGYVNVLKFEGPGKFSWQGPPPEYRP